MGFGIDPGLDAVNKRGPAASKKESCLQVILRLLCPIDRRAHNGHYSGLWSTGLDFLQVFSHFPFQKLPTQFMDVPFSAKNVFPQPGGPYSNTLLCTVIRKTIVVINIKSEEEKTAHFQNLAINRKSTIFVLSS